MFLFESLVTSTTCFGGALLFWVLWGAAENRLWREAGDAVILGHFKTYHFFMAILTVLVAALGASSWLSFVFLIVWAPLMLDVTWWSIRYLDVTHLGQTWRLSDLTIWVFPAVNPYDYGAGKAWHSRDDWDNWLGIPLIGGCYWWWWMLGGLLAVLATIQFLF